MQGNDYDRQNNKRQERRTRTGRPLVLSKLEGNMAKHHRTQGKDRLRQVEMSAIIGSVVDQARGFRFHRDLLRGPGVLSVDPASR